MDGPKEHTTGRSRRFHSPSGFPCVFLYADALHYRLGRISDRTGCDLRNLVDTFDLMVAIQLASPRNSPSLGEASTAS